MNLGLRLMATILVGLKRSPEVVAGARGEATLYRSDLRATPLCPVDGETRARVATDSAHTVYEAYVFDEVDIRNGDILISDGRDYPIRAVEPWQYAVPLGAAVVVRRLLVEDVG